MTPLLLLALASLAGGACARPCTRGAVPLVVSASSDTAHALHAAIDTVQRRWPASRAIGSWVAVTYTRGPSDTADVTVGPRCWEATDAPSATVRVAPSGRVVEVIEHPGG